MNRDPFPFHRPAVRLDTRTQSSYGSPGATPGKHAQPAASGPIPSPPSFEPPQRHRLHWPDLLKVAAVGVALFLLAMSGYGYYDL